MHVHTEYRKKNFLQRIVEATNEIRHFYKLVGNASGVATMALLPFSISPTKYLLH